MIVDQLAEYAQREATRPLPAEVTHHAKRALIDWFAALLPGIALAPGPQLMRTHADELGYGKSSLPGQRTTAFAATAAWINGSISHAAEFDDIFRARQLPRRGTVYVCAQDRDDRATPLPGPERLLCLVNAPADGDRPRPGQGHGDNRAPGSRSRCPPSPCGHRPVLPGALSREEPRCLRERWSTPR